MEQEIPSSCFSCLLLPSWQDYLALLESRVSTEENIPVSAASGVTGELKIHHDVGERFRHKAYLPEMVILPAGDFWMGAHPSDFDAGTGEKSYHQVQIPSAFAVALTPITFEQWDACLEAGGTGHIPSDAGWGRGDRPVINVSWNDAQEYIAWLNRETGAAYRLLSEAEWEYACWGGAIQKGRYPWGDDWDARQLRFYAWSHKDSAYRTQPAGGKQPNGFGLLDMLGNVHEWVDDCFSSGIGIASATTRQSLEFAGRVVKGGSWLDSARNIRPSARFRHQPGFRAYNIGFRIAMDL